MDEPARSVRKAALLDDRTWIPSVRPPLRTPGIPHSHLAVWDGDGGRRVAAPTEEILDDVTVALLDVPLVRPASGDSRPEFGLEASMGGGQSVRSEFLELVDFASRVCGTTIVEVARRRSETALLHGASA